jgi:hypothetical protein
VRTAFIAERRRAAEPRRLHWREFDVDGNLSKAGGSFKIDHPLDPANKYLYHSFVESPDMKNIYEGNVTTDGSGLETVTLPDWFEALNRDSRYQLIASVDYCSFAYSDSASFRMGMSGSASFQSRRKFWYSVFAFVISCDRA